MFGHFLLDSLFNQYLLSLGEFTMDGFGDHPEMFLCYCFFLSATFITQITFLNMLIAIMGATFGRVMENKEQYAMQTKLAIMGDYTAVINRRKEQIMDADEKFNHYLFVVRPKSGSGEENEAWSGSINLLKKSMERSLVTLQNSINKETSKL